MSITSEKDGIKQNEKNPMGMKGPWGGGPPKGQGGFDKPAVASLAIGAISNMSREELIRVIHGADLPLINSRNRHRLRFLDKNSLQRLAHLARRCCRNQGY
jgi:hypothetical protein